MQMAKSLIFLAVLMVVLMVVASASAQALPDGGLPQPWSVGDAAVSAASHGTVGMLGWAAGALDVAQLGLADLAAGVALRLVIDDRAARPAGIAGGQVPAVSGTVAAASRLRASGPPWRLRSSS